jgi:hypothetical protein
LLRPDGGTLSTADTVMRQRGGTNSNRCLTDTTVEVAPMAKVEDQPSTEPAPAEGTTTLHFDTSRTETRGPTWQPTRPGDQKLVKAKAAHDRQRIERYLDHLQIHDPAQRRLWREAILFRRSYEASRIESNCRLEEAPPNALECGLRQGWEMFKAADTGDLREHDVLKPFRDVMLALEAFKAGSLEPLLTLRGEAPNKTNAANPVDAMVRAILTLCVEKLTIGGVRNGGFRVTQAAGIVADHATAQGLPRTKLTVRYIFYTVRNRSDVEAAHWYATLSTASHQEGDVHLSREERLTWLRGVTLFAKLVES